MKMVLEFYFEMFPVYCKCMYLLGSTCEFSDINTWKKMDWEMLQERIQKVLLVGVFWKRCHVELMCLTATWNGLHVMLKKEAVSTLYLLYSR